MHAMQKVTLQPRESVQQRAEQCPTVINLTAPDDDDHDHGREVSLTSAVGMPSEPMHVDWHTPYGPDGGQHEYASLYDDDADDDERLVTAAIRHLHVHEPQPADANYLVAKRQPTSNRNSPYLRHGIAVDDLRAPRGSATATTASAYTTDAPQPSTSAEPHNGDSRTHLTGTFNINQHPETNSLLPSIPLAIHLGNGANNEHQVPLPNIHIQDELLKYEIPRPPVIAVLNKGDKIVEVSIGFIRTPSKCAKIKSFQILFLTQRRLRQKLPWLIAGEAPILKLPMAIITSMPQLNETTYFTVRAIDIYNRYGHKSLAKKYVP